MILQHGRTTPRREPYSLATLIRQALASAGYAAEVADVRDTTEE